MLAFPYERDFVQQYAAICGPVSQATAEIRDALREGCHAFEVQKYRWEALSAAERRADPFAAQEITELLDDHEAALQALLATVDEALMSKGPKAALRILERHPLPSSRWRAHQQMLQRSDKNLKTLLDNTRKRLKKGHAVKMVPHYWRQRLQEGKILPEVMLGSPYLRELLHDFLRENELYREVDEDFLTSNKRLAFPSFFV